MYELEEPHAVTFSETIHGTYIKIKEVEQNEDGSLFCIGYSDDGNFRVRVFTQQERTEEEEKAEEIDINQLLGINNWNMCNYLLPDPNISVCFVNNEVVFVAVFYNYDLRHFHFFLDVKNKCVIGSVVEIKFENCTKKNFPVKSFYNNERKEIYL